MTTTTVDHSNHGLGDESGPADSDCPCRNTANEGACAQTGCGFCAVSAATKGVIARRCIICATALERPRQRLYCSVKCNRRAAMARAKLAEAKAAAGRVEAVPAAQPQRVTAQVQPIHVTINAATGTTPAAAEVAAAMMSEIIVQRLSPPTSPPPSLPRRIGRRIAAAWHTFCFYLVSLNTD